MKKLILYFGVLSLLASCKETPKALENTVTKTVETTQKVVETTLPAAEQTAGFKLLFNGKNINGWHPYKGTQDSTYKWQINEGVLFTKGGHVDMVSDSAYENFELRFDWKVGRAGNSGFIYMVQENEPNTQATYHTGIEYQIIDHENWPDKLHESQKAGSVYDLYDPLVLASNPAGDWNSAKIISNKGHIEHYVNDKKTADYQWNSKDYLERFKKSKFKDRPFAKKIKGQFALQDHGQEVAFRNIRIKTL
jgi:Domain of Unknown Function (DUF1080)